MQKITVDCVGYISRTARTRNSSTTFPIRIQQLIEVPNTMWGFRSSSTLANIFLLLLVAMIFSVSHVSASKQFQNETDRLALLEFKKQIYNDPSGVLKSWNHSQHHCQWEGVTCGTRHQRVIALTLRHKQLSGTISPHVGNLSFMRFIHLEENQFHGEIPQEFGRLFRLRGLNLSSNAIGGEIPANLSYCTELINISMHDNKLEGKIPIDQLSSLKKLEGLVLFVNNLTGKIPSSIGNLSSLTRLAFDFNNLEGNLPMEMGLLKRFAGLGAAENNLSGIIPASIFNSSAITVISVAGNSFHGSLPTNIGLTLPNLKILGVSSNKFYGNFPTSITNASGLEELDLSRNKFKGQIPTNLGDLTNLQLLNLAVNLFGSHSTEDLDFIASLTNCSNLSVISELFQKDLEILSTYISLPLKKTILQGSFQEILANYKICKDCVWTKMSCQDR
nr:putative receptor-like protein kinase At3g47110 [Coffea arabica]